MAENPYAAPSAAIQNVPYRSATGPIRLYSPTQVACGTIGGPVGLIYFLKANFSALGNDRLARNTVLYGVLLMLALLATLPFLPDKFPNSPFTIAYILTARYVATKYQMTKQAIAESPDHDFHSNWRVLGIGLLCLVASVIVIVGPYVLLEFFGVLNA